MTVRNDLIAGIVAHLTTVFTGLAKVEEMPDHPSLMRFTHPKAAVFVGYHGTRAQKPESTAGTVQMREVRFDIATLARKLNGPQGIVNYVSMLDDALTGYRLSHGSPLYLVEDSYEDQDNGIWRFDAVFALTLPRIAAPQSVPSDPTYAPSFQWALAEDDTFGDTEVGEDPDA